MFDETNIHISLQYFEKILKLFQRLSKDNILDSYEKILPVLNHIKGAEICKTNYTFDEGIIELLPFGHRRNAMLLIGDVLENVTFPSSWNPEGIELNEKDTSACNRAKLLSG